MDLLGGPRPDDPGRPALTVAGRPLSRPALDAWAVAIAAEIRDARAVAVHATPTLETVAAVVAGLFAGVPVVPLPPDSGPDERAHILRDSGATHLLAASEAAFPDGPDVPPLVAVDRLRPAGAPDGL
ncbi:AMP-binding protein, partial [Actinomadura harenae]